MKFFSKTAWIASLLLLVGGHTRVTAEPGAQAKKLIGHFQMQKIPVEGAWFKVTYGSADYLTAAALPARYGAGRAVGSAIYALVTREDFSGMHQLKTDEIWHFYLGDPMEILLLHPDGRDEVVVLGPDPFAGQQLQFTVPAGAWMGARPVKATANAYTFFGTTMAPGFDYADFEAGYRDELQRSYPARRDMISQLTRTEQASRPASLSAAAPVPPVAAAESRVFSPDSVPMIAVAPGVDLRELVGRVAQAKTDVYSVARFALAPGKGTGTSYCKVAEEFFLIISGHGTVVVSGTSTPVQSGSVVVLKPGTKHSLTAAADSPLEFYAVTVPAFSPDDYVPVKD